MVMKLFPAILIGGPPNSGKSVLAYNISQSLREQGVQHYVLRATPDGEGDWTSEADQSLVRTILVPWTWTPDFVDHICQSLARRHLPLIVDMGGRPAPWQETILDHCTHAVLLTPDESSHIAWLDLVARHHLTLLADLHSTLQGVERVTTERPVLQGTIVGLERGRQIGGPTFQALVERITRLFAYDPEELRRSHLTTAPVETTVDLDRLAHTLGVPFAGEKAIWAPHHLPTVLDYLPENTPLAIYGRGPNWLYAALACLTFPAPFYQFDVRLGWVSPPTLSLGSSPGAPLQVHRQSQANYTQLTFTLLTAHLDYTEAQGVIVPPIPPEQGLVLSGKLPLWLWTALAITYRDAPWLAMYQPQLGNQAVVVFSRIPRMLPGYLVATSDELEM